MKRVLFVCIGNCCRSQMAEGFANTYGRDVLTARSAGLAPTVQIDPETIRTMLGKNIDISGQFPKQFDPLETLDCDLIVNMSGYDLPEPLAAPVREWTIRDPYRLRPEIYQQVCSDVENRVMQLILELRREQAGPPVKSSHRKAKKQS